MTYAKMVRLNLNPHTKVTIIYVDASYQFVSTYHWAVSVYSEQFCKTHNVRFKVERNEQHRND